MSLCRTHAIRKNGYFLTKQRSCYRRGVLWLGQTCNQRCSFCYFADAIESRFHPEHEFAPYDKAVAMCDTLRKTYNNNSVDIQGGEPTIYPRILELIKHCDSIGLKPTLITNALVLDNIDTCKKYKDSGILDFLVSVHNIGDEHDRTVGVPGAHKRQMQALDNLNKVGIPFRFNTVLTNEVIDNLHKIVDIAIEKKARACNFIGFNLSLDQLKRRTRDNVTPNHRIKNSLPLVIDRLDSHDIEVNIRYLPFCLFEDKYRKFVQNTKQTIYDLHEWEYAGRLWTQSPSQREARKALDKPVNIFDFLMKKRGERKSKIDEYFVNNPDRLLISPFVKDAPDYQKAMQQNPGDYQPLFYKDSLGPCENFSLFDYAYAEVREITTSEFRYRKLEKCNDCNLTGICDGFQKDYIDFWSDNEAIPEKSIGHIVYDPAYYMKDQMKVVEDSEADWALPVQCRDDHDLP